MDPNAVQSQQPVEIPEEIRIFLEGILEDANMVIADDEVRETMITELFMRLDKFLVSRVIQYLPQDKLDEFMEMDKSQVSVEKTYEFLKQNLPNIEEVFATAFEEFREVYLEGVNESRLNQVESTQETLPEPKLEDFMQATSLHDLAGSTKN